MRSLLFSGDGGVRRRRARAVPRQMPLTASEQPVEGVARRGRQAAPQQVLQTARAQRAHGVEQRRQPGHQPHGAAGQVDEHEQQRQQQLQQHEHRQHVDHVDRMLAVVEEHHGGRTPARHQADHGQQGHAEAMGGVDPGADRSVLRFVAHAVEPGEQLSDGLTSARAERLAEPAVAMPQGGQRRARVGGELPHEVDQVARGGRAVWGGWFHGRATA